MKVTELHVTTIDGPTGHAVVSVKVYEHDRGPVNERTGRLTQAQIDALGEWLDTLL